MIEYKNGRIKALRFTKGKKKNITDCFRRLWPARKGERPLRVLVFTPGFLLLPRRTCGAGRFAGEGAGARLGGPSKRRGELPGNPTADSRRVEAAQGRLGRRPYTRLPETPCPFRPLPPKGGKSGHWGAGGEFEPAALAPEGRSP